jgi:hypothetical protein
MLGVACISCDFDPEYVVEIGKITYSDGNPSIDSPATVTAGEEATVIVVTVGNGCVTLESTSVVLDAASADITPYDRRRIPDENEGCTQIAIPLAHKAQVRFDQPGAKTLRFHVRRATGSPANPIETTEIPVELMVE